MYDENDLEYWAPNKPQEPQEGFWGNVGNYLNAFRNDPKKMAGLAEFGRALSQAGAPSATRGNWGSALSSALGAYQNGQDLYSQAQYKKKMQDFQQTEIREQAQLRQAQAEAERKRQLQDIASGVEQNYFTQRRY